MSQRRPMPQQPPLYTTANGINRLAMSQEVSSSTRPGQNDFSPLPENDWTFTTIAAALNVGIEILETPSGKAALKRLGEEVVRDWWRSRRYRFGGDVNRMSHYVDQFLAALRRDFPNIMIADLGGPNVLASTKRLGSTMWNGDLDNFLPKVCVGIYFNACRVSDMVAAISGTRNAGSIRRYKHFLFMFGVATSHELCHAFVAYLSQNSQDDDSFTPPRVTHLNYASPNPNPTQAPLATGESGRWFENRLFGGSLEFYRDNRADERQPGIPHVIDEGDVAWKIDPSDITGLVETPRRLVFPFRRVGNGITPQDRARLRMRTLGSTDSAPGPQAGQRFMRAQLPRGPQLYYNVSREALRRVAMSPGPLGAIRVR